MARAGTGRKRTAAAGGPDRERSNRRDALVGAMLTVIVAAVSFASVGGAGFVQDDVPIIQLNPIVREGSIATIFTTDWWAGVGGQDDSLYRPVTLWSFALERDADGSVDPGGAHVTNLALHAVVSLLLLGLGTRLGAGPRVASAAALIFAAHPVHTAAVAGLVGRADLLAALFGLAAILLYATVGRRERPAAWGAAACVLLAAGSKETGLVVVVLLVLFDLVFRPRVRAPLRSWLVERGAALAPSALAVTVYLVMRGYALGVFPGLQRVNAYENPIVALDGVERVATALAVAGRAAWLFVWPSTLSADYSGHGIATEPTLLAPWPLLGLACLAALVTLGTVPWVARAFIPAGDAATILARWRVAAFAAWLVLLPWAVVSNLVVPAGQIFAERFLYFPSAGVCLLVPVLVAIGGRRLLERRAGETPMGTRAAAVVLAIVVVAGIVRTRAGVEDWRTDETLYEAARRAVPNAPRASFTLAKIRLSQGRTDEALALLEETLRLWPRQSGASVDKGTLLAQRGDLEGAARAFRDAVGVNPYNQRAVLSLAAVLERLGRREEAERLLRGAVRRFPNDAAAREALARVAG